MTDDDQKPSAASEVKPVSPTASGVRRVDRDRVVLEFKIEDLLQELMRDPSLRAPVAACNGCNNCKGD